MWKAEEFMAGHSSENSLAELRILSLIRLWECTCLISPIASDFIRETSLKSC